MLKLCKLFVADLLIYISKGELSSYLSKIRVVRLIFLGHEEKEDPIEELKTIERGHTHVQEHSVQHRHGNLNRNILYFAWSSDYASRGLSRYLRERESRYSTFGFLKREVIFKSMIICSTSNFLENGGNLLQNKYRLSLD